MRVIVESPFAGSNPENNKRDFALVKYSRECLRDSLDRGESPYASHLLYTQKGVLDDTIPEERARGIDAAAGWLEVADHVAVYCDLGFSPGMAKGVLRAWSMQKPVKFRWIRGEKKEIAAL